MQFELRNDRNSPDLLVTLWGQLTLPRVPERLRELVGERQAERAFQRASEFVNAVIAKDEETP
jgi:hypothetical protein